MRRLPPGRTALVMALSLAVASSGRAQPLPGPPEPPDHPFLSYGVWEDWTLVSTLAIKSCFDPLPTRQPRPAAFDLPRHQRFEFESVRLWYPIGVSTSTSLPVLKAFGASYLIDGQEIPGADRVAVEFGSRGGRYAEVNFGNASFVDVRFEFESTHRSWRPRIDEARARRVAWPTSGYPEALDEYFRSQYGVIISGDQPAAVGNEAAAAYAAWTAGPDDPRARLGPYDMAKYLVGRVIQHVAVNEAGASDALSGQHRRLFRSNTGINPMSPDAAWRALRVGDGHAFERTLAAVAVLLEAGIPARPVYGARSLRGSVDQEQPLFAEAERQRRFTQVVPWLEFYLFDEETGEGGWIPVDVVRQQEFGTLPPLDRPWAFFGHHRDLEMYVPIAVALHPPVDSTWFFVPALWGWQTAPYVPGCGNQVIETELISVTRKGGNPTPVIQRPVRAP